MRSALAVVVTLAGCATDPAPYAAQRAAQLNATGHYHSEMQMLRIALEQLPPDAHEQELDLVLRLARAEACYVIESGGDVPGAAAQLEQRADPLEPHASPRLRKRLSRTVADLAHAETDPKPWARVRCVPFDRYRLRLGRC